MHTSGTIQLTELIRVSCAWPKVHLLQNVGASGLPIAGEEQDFKQQTASSTEKPAGDSEKG
jgi:hypothetical protein